jgi:transposase
MPKATTGDRPELKPVNVRAAAIDMDQKCTWQRSIQADTPVCAFGKFAQDLHDLADWFKACGVTTVA